MALHKPISSHAVIFKYVQWNFFPKEQLQAIILTSENADKSFASYVFPFLWVKFFKVG